MRAIIFPALIMLASPLHALSADGRVDSAASQAAPELLGNWKGALDIGGGKSLRLALHFADKDGDGALEGTAISIDQGGMNMQLSDIENDGDTLRFKLAIVGGSYEGRWQDGHWVGIWSQGGGSLPLNFERGSFEDRASAPITPTSWSLPTNQAVADRLKQLLADEPGLVAGAALAEPGKRRFVETTGIGSNRQIEIGSVSKVFTALLLADMVLDGSVSLDDDLGKLMPGVATDKVAAITLAQLANHHSGLPRLPGNLMVFLSAPDPYAKYDEAMLLDFVRTVVPARRPGEGFEYSNAGAGLLGYLLGRIDGSDYQTALSKRIIEPMGLAATGFAIADDALLGVSGGEEVPLWHFDALAGAGALRSTMADMANFTMILADPGERWGRHLELLLKAPKDLPNGMKIGLGLFSVPLTPTGMLFHNGGTGSFKTSLWADPALKRGAFVVINSGTSDPDKLGAWMISGVERK